MIKITRRYTNQIGAEVADFQRAGKNRHGTILVRGRTDEQLIADIEKQDAIIAEARANAKPVHGDPTKPPKPGSLLYRMQEQIQVAHPEIFTPHITEQWKAYWRDRGEYP